MMNVALIIKDNSTNDNPSLKVDVWVIAVNENANEPDRTIISTFKETIEAICIVVVGASYKIITKEYETPFPEPHRFTPRMFYPVNTDYQIADWIDKATHTVFFHSDKILFTRFIKQSINNN